MLLSASEPHLPTQQSFHFAEQYPRTSENEWRHAKHRPTTTTTKWFKLIANEYGITFNYCQLGNKIDTIAPWMQREREENNQPKENKTMECIFMLIFCCCVFSCAEMFRYHYTFAKTVEWMLYEILTHMPVWYIHAYIRRPVRRKEHWGLLALALLKSMGI